MTATHRHPALERLDPCAGGLTFARKYATMQEVWDKCERGDWMLWLAGRLAGEPGSRRPLVLAACECARLSLPIFEARYPGDKRPRRAIETAEAWARGEPGVTIERVRSAAHAATNAAVATYAASAAADAAANAALAVYAPDATADTAATRVATTTVAAAVADAAYLAYVAHAAHTAHAAAAVATYAAITAANALRAALKQCADIVRKHYPACPLKDEA